MSKLEHGSNEPDVRVSESLKHHAKTLDITLPKNDDKKAEKKKRFFSGKMIPKGFKNWYA